MYLLAAVTIAVQEMKFCSATANCVAHTMHCAMMRCVAVKTVSTACLITDSIFLSYRDILLIANRGSSVTK